MAAKQFVVLTSVSVGEGAQRSLQLEGMGRRSRRTYSRPSMAATGPTRPWLPQGERGQVGGLVGRAAERPGQLGRPQGVADLDPAAAAVVPAGRGRTARHTS